MNLLIICILCLNAGNCLEFDQKREEKGLLGKSGCIDSIPFVEQGDKALTRCTLHFSWLTFPPVLYLSYFETWIYIVFQKAGTPSLGEHKNTRKIPKWTSSDFIITKCLFCCGIALKSPIPKGKSIQLNAMYLNQKLHFWNHFLHCSSWSWAKEKGKIGATFPLLSSMVNHSPFICFFRLFLPRG